MSRGSDCEEAVLGEGVLRAHPPYVGAGESGSKGSMDVWRVPQDPKPPTLYY